MTKNLSQAAISFRRILIPTDFSDVSQRAVEYAKSIARKHGSQLLLVHVSQPVNPIAAPESTWIDQDEVQQKVEEELEQNGAELRSEGFQAQAISVIGAVQNEVLSLVSKEKADLIVAGTHGRAGVERLFLGSDAEALLRNTDCPVMVIGPAAPPAGNGAWHPKDVICATTLDPDSAWIAAYAYRLANEYQAEFMAFNVDNCARMSAYDDWLRFENAFEKSLPEGIRPSSPLRTVLSDSHTEYKIVEVAKERHSTLIVMGAHSASAAATHFLRGITPRVLAEAPCPVLILHRR